MKEKILSMLFPPSEKKFVSENFNVDMGLEELMEKVNSNGASPEMVHAGSVLINYKLQRELFEAQKAHNLEQIRLQEKILQLQHVYHKKQLFWTRILAIVTLLLVVITLVIVKLG